MKLSQGEKNAGNISKSVFIAEAFQLIIPGTWTHVCKTERKRRGGGKKGRRGGVRHYIKLFLKYPHCDQVRIML